ncbi:hypothetical protein [Cypionkella sinensis]|uniref:Uncharacterized protein n=1 Tax=Cypionkella sinensis TaxID=1756043 RepID=A0ABV7IVZ0_9RHOB
MSDNAAKIDIVTAAANLERAVQAHAEAKRATDTARRAETAELNFLNEAQKAFDEVVADIRKAAGHRDSAWSNIRQQVIRHDVE